MDHFPGSYLIPFLICQNQFLQLLSRSCSFFQFVWNQLGESKSTDGYVVDEIGIVLVQDGARDKDCVPDTTQGGQFKYQRKPKFIPKRAHLKGEIA